MPTPPRASPLRLALLALVWLVAGALTAELLGWTEPLKTRWHRASPTQPTVLFVVLDTVRVDRLSACGHQRPTSPHLDALADKGALSCGGVAPGSWTYPSHASYFTGLPVAEHGAHFVPDAEGTEVRRLSIRPLPAELPTLAEQLAARGMQARGVSGNPVLTEASGLTRGFESFATAPTFGPWYGEGLVSQVRDTLRSADPDRPLFLFVNIADAHDPWAPVPEESPVADAVDEGLLYFALDPETGEIERGTWARYVTGELSAEEQQATRDRVTALYDHALWKADQTLQQVLDTVAAHGWADAGIRIVLTSDHGEFLGEHGLLRHGRYLLEGNSRVPVLHVELDGSGVPAEVLPLPGLLSALEVHHLVLDGARPATPPPVVASAYPDALWAAQSNGRVGVHTSAAHWQASGRKEAWMDGSATWVDLIGDPGELRPQPMPLTEATKAMQAAVAATQASAAGAVETSPEMLEALEAAGYVDR